MPLLGKAVVVEAPVGGFGIEAYNPNGIWSHWVRIGAIPKKFWKKRYIKSVIKEISVPVVFHDKDVAQEVATLMNEAAARACT